MTSTIASSFLDEYREKLDGLCKLEVEASGRGIVIAAGGASIFTNAYVLIHVLRKHLKCQLPIEVWHFGMAELSPRMLSLLHELDVETVDAAPLIKEKNAPIRDGWQLKAFALLWSRFSEILLLDADQIPALDPAVAFEWREYQEQGAVFWPDIIELREDNPIWALMGLAPRQARSLESGQLLVDKRRHWKALCAAYLLNAAAETVYQLIYGDKDTFLVAWLFTGSPFSLVPHLPFIEELCLTQRDFSGTIFMQHRTNGKWNYSGEQVLLQQELHADASAAALTELRQKWNGRIFIPPGRSLAARSLETEIIATGSLQFEMVGVEQFLIEFWPDGEIGHGRNYDRQNWMVVDDDDQAGRPCLVILDGSEPVYRLYHGADGVWQGERLSWPEGPVLARSPTKKSADHAAIVRRTLVDEFLVAANFFHGTSDADQALCAALVLLSRIEPDVPERLQALGCGQPPGIAARLQALADAVSKAQPEALRPVNKNAEIIANYYIRQTSH